MIFNKTIYVKFFVYLSTEMQVVYLLSDVLFNYLFKCLFQKEGTINFYIKKTFTICNKKALFLFLSNINIKIIQGIIY